MAATRGELRVRYPWKLAENRLERFGERIRALTAALPTGCPRLMAALGVSLSERWSGALGCGPGTGHSPRWPRSPVTAKTRGPAHGCERPPDRPSPPVPPGSLCSVPEFAKPTGFSFDVERELELGALNQHREARDIPPKEEDRLLLATWNLANFEVQDREAVHLDLIGEIVGWFDLIALQEIRDDLSGLRALRARLPRGWALLFSEASGNDERQAFAFDSAKTRVGEKVGKLTIPPSRLADAGGEAFRGFDRTPYLAAFEAGRLTLLLANVHSFYGGSDNKNIERRAGETRAIAWWCDKRSDDPHAYTRDILALGDFNLPRAEAGDPIYDELTRRGLQLPEHQTKIGTTIAGDSVYDQVAYVPAHTGADLTGRAGVFDFDAVIFRRLWDERGERDFDAYTRWAISDHRPLWVEMAI